MLLALTRPSRSADLSKLDMRFRTYTAKGVIFQPTHLSKQSRSSKPIREFFFPFYVADEDICPVRALQSYKERTLSFREKNTKPTLLLSWIGKHDPMSSSTIARWLRMYLQEAGIDTDTFKAYSVRGAASSTAAWLGVTIMDILNAADWSAEATFQQFCHREMQDMTILGPQFFHLPPLQTYMLIWKQSLPKCNLRMAQGTECLHAIGNCTRKVKLKYQHVPP